MKPAPVPDLEGISLTSLTLPKQEKYFLTSEFVDSLFNLKFLAIQHMLKFDNLFGYVRICISDERKSSEFFLKVRSSNKEMIGLLVALSLTSLHSVIGPKELK
jgi:hypothetical protein